jgi:hypothetical protein
VGGGGSVRGAAGGAGSALSGPSAALEHPKRQLPDFDAPIGGVTLPDDVSRVHPIALEPERTVPAELQQELMLPRGHAAASSPTAGAGGPSDDDSDESALEMAELAQRVLASDECDGAAASSVDDLLLASVDAANRDVGRWGEWLCYRLLCLDERRRQERDPSSSPRCVVWVNQHGETYQPYDIKYGDELIEVKSTRSADRRPFDVSAAEMRAAMQARARYSIWRVSSALRVETARVQRVNDPAQLWHEKAVRVTMML